MAIRVADEVSRIGGCNDNEEMGDLIVIFNRNSRLGES